MMIKQLDKTEIIRISEIDRTEKIKLLYKYNKGKLETELVDIDVPRWDHPDWCHDEKLIKDLSDNLERGAVLFGAFKANKLVGMAVIGYELRGENSDMLQLVTMHVSNNYRRKGIGTKLLEECKKIARKRGAKRLYISSTPSESAVGFYLSYGSKLADRVDTELYALEPEDIHFVMDLY